MADKKLTEIMREGNYNRNYYQLMAQQVGQKLGEHKHEELAFSLALQNIH